MTRVLRELDQQRRLFKSDESQENAKIFAKSSQRVSNTILEIQRNLKWDALELKDSKVGSANIVQAKRTSQNLADKARVLDA